MFGNAGLRMIVDLLIFLAAGVAGGVIGYLLMKSRQLQTRNEAEALLVNAQAESKRIVAEAESRAKTIALSAQEQKVQILEESENEVGRRRREMERAEERIQRRQEAMDGKLEQVDQRNRKLDQRQVKLDKREADLTKLEEDRRTELERIASMSQEEARQELLAAVEQSTRQDMARKIREVEAQATAEADSRAREVISNVMERVASDHVSETTVSSVPLPTDEMKGRIIGRQGRNIRAIEQVTGVDLVVDDTPEAILISSFDPIRREVARIALSRLVQDGRIHPARIEKEVEKAQQEVEKSIKEAGEQAVIEVGLQMLHPELVKLLGRLKSHQLRAKPAFACGGGDAHRRHAGSGARRQHPAFQDGRDAARHRQGREPRGGRRARPGWRGHRQALRRAGRRGEHHRLASSRDRTDVGGGRHRHHGRRHLRLAARCASRALETYVKRIQALEDISNSFPGVQQTYAIQAGREVRVIVRPDDIDDLASIRLAKDIAKKIEDNLEYPGQIKVTVVRETRAVELAK